MHLAAGVESVGPFNRWLQNPVHAHSSTLTATGRMVEPGKRVAFAEGEVVDAAGTVVATATSTLLVFPLPPALTR